jgi:hypothetical protein
VQPLLERVKQLEQLKRDRVPDPKTALVITAHVDRLEDI